jgi:hypothetical protein
MRTIRIALLVVFASILMTVAADAATRVYVRVAPPRTVVERTVVAPHPNWVWQPGYHRWTGNEYTWVAGTWAAPPYRHAHWIAGHWRHTSRGYYWVEGHWSRSRR